MKTPCSQAALERKYSGSPGEAFYTGGGVHVFANFEKSEDFENFTVASGFQNSVNLVFIRLMRDIVNYYRYRVPGATPAVLEDWDNPARQKYLARFADEEGKVYLSRFYAKYRGETSDQALGNAGSRSESHSVAGRCDLSLRSAASRRSIQFTAFLKRHFAKGVLVKKNDPAELYEKYGPDKFDLADRGYLAHVHPLELWMLNYREQHPTADFKELAAQSAQLRQDVYWWLFHSHSKHQQDIRIRTLTEQDAFREIHKAWKRQGYPFDSLVPSYATVIGVSGDTPAALADLMGILVNNGVRNPSIKIERLHFGANTPTETVMARETAPGERVIAPEIAALVRQQLIGVVENGTGRRAQGGIVMPGGQVIPVGGKTGTGDNRLESFSANGHVIGDKAVSRTATFVFMIGDRFYGTIVAFVPGSKAASYKFTSALAVQIFKDLDAAAETLMSGLPNSRQARVTPLENRATKSQLPASNASGLINWKLPAQMPISVATVRLALGRDGPPATHWKHAPNPPGAHRARFPRRRDFWQSRVLQSRRFGEGSGRVEHDPGGRAHGKLTHGQDPPGCHQRKHRDRLCHDRRVLGLQGEALPPEKRLHGAQARAAGLRRRDGIQRSGRRVGRRHPAVPGDLQGDPERYFYPDQYNNPANWKAHYNGTALEILAQTDGRITHFVASMGTSGTFMGNTRRLREEIPGVKCISAQPSSGFPWAGRFEAYAHGDCSGHL